ncbi:MAG: MgtC/SapB family protein [Acidobacteria bacterium]|nr:MgtC/SapB family protein [Acidobacteriota bacterium]
MTYAEIAGRLFMALAFGIIVGIERQWHHKNAGIKTNTLVAVGAAAFALISAHGFGVNSNPAQIAAGVVTGIGFIGGGVIMRQGKSVQGINSAATLWATASMGLAIGQGYHQLALLLFVVILLIQFVLKSISNFVDKHSGAVMSLITYHIGVRFQPSAAAAVREVWSHFSERKGILIETYQEMQEESATILIEADFCLAEFRAQEMMDLHQQFARLAGVLKTEWSQQTAKEGN